MDKICILIPAYNAQETLGFVLKKIEPFKIDTVVVDDGSSDETKRVALENGAQLLEHPLNLGKGAALRTGFQYILQRDYQMVQGAILFLACCVMVINLCVDILYTYLNPRIQYE